MSVKAGSKLDSLFELIALGNSEHLSSVLKLLFATNLYVPLKFGENIDPSADAETYTIPTFNNDKRTLIPVFTNEGFFQAWSGARYEFFCVEGSNLGLSVPANSWLVVNPGQQYSIRLSPDDVSRLSKISSPGHVPEYVEKVSALESHEKIELSSSVVVKKKVKDEAEIRTIVELELVNLLASCKEVSEAYYLERRTQFAEGSLGLLTDNLPADRRFMLIEEIGEISRKHYLAAGAIEVFDDLNSKSSRSWELFSSLAPFYMRDDLSEKESEQKESEQNSAEKSCEIESVQVQVKDSDSFPTQAPASKPLISKFFGAQKRG